MTRKGEEGKEFILVRRTLVIKIKMNDYWITYCEFCKDLESNGKIEIVEKLKDAQGFVNGMTDGWFQFLSELMVIRKDYSRIFSKPEIKMVDYLICRVSDLLVK